MDWTVPEQDIRDLFRQYGPGEEIVFATFPDGKRRSFIFVEMPDEGGLKAIIGLDTQEFRGRRLRVAKAFPRPEHKY